MFENAPILTYYRPKLMIHDDDDDTPASFRAKKYDVSTGDKAPAG